MVGREGKCEMDMLVLGVEMLSRVKIHCTNFEMPSTTEDKKYLNMKCVYSAEFLKHHKISVHNMGGKKFICDTCPFLSTNNGRIFL